MVERVTVACLQAHHWNARLDLCPGHLQLLIRMCLREHCVAQLLETTQQFYYYVCFYVNIVLPCCRRQPSSFINTYVFTWTFCCPVVGDNPTVLLIRMCLREHCADMLSETTQQLINWYTFFTWTLCCHVIGDNTTVL